MQNMNTKVLEDGEENIGVGSANSNIPNNGSSSINGTNANHQHQEFNLDDLNFDPAALIGGNGENTDLNVSILRRPILSTENMFH